MNILREQTKKIYDSTPVSDGAGVKLKRIIGSQNLDHIDPFVLLDEFKSKNVNDYMAGFPDHPHRGIETITYMIHGKFRHRDSEGNGGILGPGDVQWMTAGKGIIHSEMPEMEKGLLWGYQLWLSLPAKDKMTNPRYQHLHSEEIPVINDNFSEIRLIAGRYHEETGPAETWFPIDYFDVRIKIAGLFRKKIESRNNTFIYVHTGSVIVKTDDGMELTVGNGELALIENTKTIEIGSSTNNAGFLFISGRPNKEPIARRGPFVMNTDEELVKAFDDYYRGEFT